MKDFVFVLFGATGDLAMKKIFPSLFALYERGEFKAKFKILAASRSKLDNTSFLKELEKKAKIQDKSSLKYTEFISQISYLSMDFSNSKDFEELENLLQNEKNIIIYFSISPYFFTPACENLAKVSLNDKRVKIVLEKPLGVDLKSCKNINASIGKYFSEEQIYRIDHYLGKESIQNILYLRAFNPLLKALWNNKFIACMQISVYESLGIESRGEFYDKMGASRDMLQNHMLQILSLLTMKLPKKFDSDSIRKAKCEILKSLKPISDFQNEVIRAQYTANLGLKGYLEEENIPSSSKTESFVALKAELLDESFKGVPFFLRTGKRMNESYVSVVVEFKEDAFVNKLVLNIQPKNQILLYLNHKTAGQNTLTQKPLKLNLSSGVQAYEKLILDVILGDATYFNHKEELEAAWSFLDPVLSYFQKENTPLFYYKAKSKGPKEAIKLIERENFTWL